jgi:hypothetical protein
VHDVASPSVKTQAEVDGQLEDGRQSLPYRITEGLPVIHSESRLRQNPSRKEVSSYGGQLPQLSPDSAERIALKIDMILLIDSEAAKS